MRARLQPPSSGEPVPPTSLLENPSLTTFALSFDHCAVDDCFGGTSSSRWEVLVDGVVVFETEAASTTICVRTADGGQGGIDNLVLCAQ